MLFFLYLNVYIYTRALFVRARLLVFCFVALILTLAFIMGCDKTTTKIAGVISAFKNTDIYALNTFKKYGKSQ